MIIKKLYLAHPFTERKHIREWELSFEQRTGIEMVNPFYDLNRKDVELIDAGLKGRHDENYVSLVERDLKAIRESDGIVGFVFPDVVGSIGTPMELMYAKLCKFENIFAVAWGLSHHPWIRWVSDKVFSSHIDFEFYITKRVSQ